MIESPNGRPKMPAKISIAMPTHDMVPARFMYDLASLVMYSVAAMPEDVQFGINMVPGTYVHSARQQLLEQLLADGVTHILWLDTDMEFPRESLVRLLQHGEKIVGINYAQRGVPTDFVAIKRMALDENDKSERLVTDDDSTGLEEVDAIGFGMVLMRVDALRDLPSLDDTPWFWFDWLPGRRQMGEDVYFCKMLRELGQTIYVDHDLSKECGHIGQFTYRCQHAVELRTLEEV